MEFVKLEDVVKKIDCYKREALEACVDIKVNSEVDRILKNHFEEILKSLVDSWFEDLSYEIESKTNLYVDVKPFSKRLNLNKNELENILESNDIESITIINIDKILNKTTGLMNSFKIE